MAALWGSRRGGGGWRPGGGVEEGSWGGGEDRGKNTAKHVDEEGRAGGAQGGRASQRQMSDGGEMGGHDQGGRERKGRGEDEGRGTLLAPCAVERLCRRLQYRLEAADEGSSAAPHPRPGGVDGFRGELLEALGTSSALAVVTELLSAVDPTTAGQRTERPPTHKIGICSSANPQP